MPEPLLTVENLHVTVEGKEILRGVDLTVPVGEIHALMGPNGSGKSTLAYTLMGHPKYTVTEGTMVFRGRNVAELSADERARLGMFLSFQYPMAVPGVTMVNFLRAALKGLGKDMPARQFLQSLKKNMAELHMDEAFTRRYLNDGFSGGEKKRAEILQLAMLEPKLAILDETDSGLDVDALRTVAEGVWRVAGRAEGAAPSEMGILVITHYSRILDYLKPDVVHILSAGRVIASGGAELAQRIEAGGYDPILAAAAANAANSVDNPHSQAGSAPVRAHHTGP